MTGTTIVCIRHKGRVALAGDGQVTLHNTVMKHSARKVRRLYQDKCIAGFAGATADAFTLFERFEKKLEQFNGNLTRAAVELSKDWRTDRMLRRPMGNTPLSFPAPATSLSPMTALLRSDRAAPMPRQRQRRLLPTPTSPRSTSRVRPCSSLRRYASTPTTGLSSRSSE
jgi:hypothetical protein